MTLRFQTFPSSVSLSTFHSFYVGSNSFSAEVGHLFPLLLYPSSENETFEWGLKVKLLSLRFTDLTSNILIYEPKKKLEMKHVSFRSQSFSWFEIIFNSTQILPHYFGHCLMNVSELYFFSFFFFFLNKYCANFCSTCEKVSPAAPF